MTHQVCTCTYSEKKIPFYEKSKIHEFLIKTGSNSDSLVSFFRRITTFNKAIKYNSKAKHYS